MPTLTKLYSMEEASQHNTQEDCWVVIDGKLSVELSSRLAMTRGVKWARAGEATFAEAHLFLRFMTLSSYLDEHPGGDDVLLRATGKDATDEFEDAGHSKSARELMESFCIGELDPTSPAIPELEIVSNKQELQSIPQKVINLSKQYWVVPVAVGLSVVVGFLYLRKK
ncbi:Cytochrome [Forsythia ovata]|uniref:Cytochrome n=1 Tax=Forsythia ovata TaxID=205694 RepID=A0ABD1WD17_9LAMI